MKFDNMKFKELRLRRSLTQESVAKACGVTKQTVAKWEKSTKPDADKIKHITSILSCRVSDLLDISDFDEIDADREQLKREHYGADVWEDVSLMESLQFELATLKKNDPSYRIKVLGLEDQIERCKAEIARKTKEAKEQNGNALSPSVSVNGNGNAVGHAAMVLSDACPYADEPLSSVELFRSSLIVHLMDELKDVPSDVLMRVLFAVKNFRKSSETSYE